MDDGSKTKSVNMIDLGLRKDFQLTTKNVNLYDQDHSHFFSLSSVIIGLIMFLTYYVGRIGMSEIPNFHPLMLSVSALLLPGALRPICRLNIAFLQTAVLFVFFLVGWISILLKINLAIILYATFLISILHQVKFVRISIGKYKAIKIALIVLIGLDLAASVWTPDYMNPLAPEAYGVGLRFIHVDTLFLSTLTSNIKNFHFSTLGLFGLEPLKYHSGSNYLFASYSQLCRTDTLQFYNLAFPVIFIPQFFQAFLFAVFSNERVKRSDITIVVTLIIFFFVLTGFVSQSLGSDYMLPSSLNSHFLSQSYCVSLILAFLFISAYSPLYKKDYLDSNPYVSAVLIILIPCWFFIMGFVKVSTGVVIFAAFAYFVFRRRLILNRWVFIAMTLSCLALYFVLELTVESNENTFIIQPGSFFRMFVKGNVPMYVLLNYSWLILLIVSMIVMQRRKRSTLYVGLLSGRFVVVETIIVAAIVGALPGVLIHIEGGSAIYFSDIQYWLAAIALTHMASYFVFKYHGMQGKALTFVRISAFILTAIIVRESVFRSYYYFLKKNIRIRAALVYGKENQRLQEAKVIELLPIMSSLLFRVQEAEQYRLQTSMLGLSMFRELRNLPDSIRTQSLIYCEDPQMLEEFLPCSEATFYITGLSEMAMINGLYWKDCWLAGGYGMRTYFPFPKEISRGDASQLARERGFQNLIVINLQDQKYIIEKL